MSRNPKVHYRTHKRPPPVSILGQPHPVHIPTSHLLDIHSDIIHTSTPRSPQWSLSLRFPHQDSIHPPSLYPYAPHAQPISFFSLTKSVSVLQVPVFWRRLVRFFKRMLCNLSYRQRHSINYNTLRTKPHFLTI